MKYLLFLLILTLPLGQLGRISISPGVNLYAHDLVVFTLLLFYALKPHKLISPLLKPIIIFVFVALLSLLRATSYQPLAEVLIGSLYLWRWTAYAAIYFLVRKSHLNLSPLMIASGFIAAVVGLLQYLALPDTRFLYTNFWDNHLYRLVGAWFDPGFTGIMLVLTILLIINNFKKSVTRYLLLTICFTALMLTYSRASYLSFIVGLSGISFFQKSVRPVLIGTILILLTVLILPRPAGEGVRLERTQSIIDRGKSSQLHLKIISQNPIIGVGFNTLRYQPQVKKYFGPSWTNNHAAAGSDNSFIFIAATTGLLGLLAYLNLLKHQLIISIKQKYFLFAGSLLAVIAHAQFNNTLFYPWVMLWLWLLLAANPTRENKSL